MKESRIDVISELQFCLQQNENQEQFDKKDDKSTCENNSWKL